VSIVAADWMWVPAETTARGAIRIESSRTVAMLGGEVPPELSVLGAVAEDEDVCGPPITDFSPTIHPSPTLMGPSNERNLARG